MGQFYRDSKEINYDSSNLYRIANAISDTGISNASAQVTSITKRETIGSVTAFVNKYFDFHDIRMIKDSLYTRRCIMKMQGDRNKLTKDLVKMSVVINPLDLPVKYTLDNICKGNVDERLLTSISNGKTLEQLFYLNIGLPKQVTTLTPSTYIHELAHTQVNSIDGTLRYEFNEELISILLEFLFLMQKSQDRETLYANKIYRANDIVVYTGTIAAHELGITKISDKDYNNCFTYVASTLQAISLLQLFKKGDYLFKRTMLRNVQLIFDGLMQVEDFLDIYNINLETMTDEKRILSFLKK